ncbi:hypothetical protein V6N11_049173 [Hibiscus sabdariffa]|uniref:Uncharacterized protein n=1 Tax=Hibiscus sabdariffa TaxID=183260 RepID=A0ABR1ZCR5_9ROSI
MHSLLFHKTRIQAGEYVNSGLLSLEIFSVFGLALVQKTNFRGLFLPDFVYVMFWCQITVHHGVGKSPGWMLVSKTYLLRAADYRERIVQMSESES